MVQGTDNEENLPDTLQFSTSVYYCSESEGFVELTIQRFGRADFPVSVEFCTEDISAKEGIKYKAVDQRVEFKPSQTSQTISIELVENDSYDSLLEFRVYLKNPSGAILGNYLYECRVVIEDDDSFPSNRFKNALLSCQSRMEAQTGLPKWTLMREYIRMHLREKKLKNKCVRLVLVDQLTNFKYLWHLVIFMRLIDNVLKPTPGSTPLPWPLDNLDQHEALPIILGLFLVPMPFLVSADIYKANLRVAGMAITRLQENLMRKYLNLSEGSLRLVGSSDVNQAISRDVPELVRQGFCVTFDIVREAGLLLYLLATVILKDNWPLWLTIMLFVAFPVLMSLFLILRQPGSSRRRQELFRCEANIIEFVQSACACYRLISDYGQYVERVIKFGDKVKELNAAITTFFRYSSVNLRFAPALSMVLVSIFIGATYRQVLDETMPIGEFVGAIAIWQAIGNCYQQIYEHLLKMQDAIDPLHNVSFYMNLPTRINDEMQRSRWLMKEAELARKHAYELLYKNPSPGASQFINPHIAVGAIAFEQAAYAEDLFMIQCRNMNFTYPHTTARVLSDVSFQVKQGDLIAVMGGRGAGKSTLLQLLAGVLSPHLSKEEQRESQRVDHAGFFMPPHLRVLHVSYEPVIIPDIGVWDNLCFGPSNGADEAIGRVLTICRRLGMSQAVIDIVEAEEFSSKKLKLQRTSTRELVERGSSIAKTGGVELSYSDRCLIHLARALIMNPEVMVVHKPLVHFDKDHGHRVLNLLREHVDERGIEKDPETRHLRRPRTCIYSASLHEGAEIADTVLRIVDHVVDGKRMQGSTVQSVEVEELHRLKGICSKIFMTLDDDHNRTVDLAEFLQVVPQQPWIMHHLGISDRHITGPQETLEELLKVVFHAVDVSGDGAIDLSELVHFMNRHSPGIDSKDRNGEDDAYLLEADGSNQGNVCKEDMNQCTQLDKCTQTELHNAESKRLAPLPPMWTYDYQPEHLILTARVDPSGGLGNCAHTCSRLTCSRAQ